MEDFKAETGTVGRTVSVTVEIENLGPGRAEKLYSSLDCEGAVMEVSRSFVGKLNDEESVPMVFQIIPEQENVDCEFQTSYTDSQENTLNVENSFSFEPRSYRNYFIAGAVLVLVVLAYLYNRRSEDELEEV